MYRYTLFAILSGLPIGAAIGSFYRRTCGKFSFTGRKKSCRTAYGTHFVPRSGGLFKVFIDGNE
jgi:hypothetical protein